jgi:hypothetical protein
MFALPPRGPFTWWQQSTFGKASLLGNRHFSPVTKTTKESYFDM